MADYVTLGVTVMSSAAAGWVVGWATKKLLSVIEAFVALETMILLGLGWLGIVTFNVDALLYWVGWLSQKIWGSVDMNALVNTFGVMLVPGFIGFLLGLAKSPSYSHKEVVSEWIE